MLILVQEKIDFTETDSHIFNGNINSLGSAEPSLQLGGSTPTLKTNS